MQGSKSFRREKASARTIHGPANVAVKGGFKRTGTHGFVMETDSSLLQRFLRKGTDLSVPKRQLEGSGFSRCDLFAGTAELAQGLKPAKVGQVVGWHD